MRATILLPQKKALRATKDNRERFEQQRAQLEAQNLKRREEAERVAERVGGLSVVIIRQAGESGSLHGSVSARDIAEATTAAGLTIDRGQVVLSHPIKTLGLSPVRIVLHPEVLIPVNVNVARSQEEAERQARGERVGSRKKSSRRSTLPCCSSRTPNSRPCEGRRRQRKVSDQSAVSVGRIGIGGGGVALDPTIAPSAPPLSAPIAAPRPPPAMPPSAAPAPAPTSAPAAARSPGS